MLVLPVVISPLLSISPMTRVRLLINWKLIEMTIIYLSKWRPTNHRCMLAYTRKRALLSLREDFLLRCECVEEDEEHAVAVKNKVNVGQMAKNTLTYQKSWIDKNFAQLEK